MRIHIKKYLTIWAIISLPFIVYANFPATYPSWITSSELLVNKVKNFMNSSCVWNWVIISINTNWTVNCWNSNPNINSVTAANSTVTLPSTSPWWNKDWYLMWAMRKFLSTSCPSWQFITWTKSDWSKACWSESQANLSAISQWLTFPNTLPSWQDSNSAVWNKILKFFNTQCPSWQYLAWVSINWSKICAITSYPICTAWWSTPCTAKNIINWICSTTAWSCIVWTPSWDNNASCGTRTWSCLGSNWWSDTVCTKELTACTCTTCTSWYTWDWSTCIKSYTASLEGINYSMWVAWILGSHWYGSSTPFPGSIWVYWCTSIASNLCNGYGTVYWFAKPCPSGTQWVTSAMNTTYACLSLNTTGIFGWVYTCPSGWTLSWTNCILTQAPTCCVPNNSCASSTCIWTTCSDWCWWLVSWTKNCNNYKWQSVWITCWIPPSYPQCSPNNSSIINSSCNVYWSKCWAYFGYWVAWCQNWEPSFWIAECK